MFMILWNFEEQELKTLNREEPTETLGRSGKGTDTMWAANTDARITCILMMDCILALAACRILYMW